MQSGLDSIWSTIAHHPQDRGVGSDVDGLLLVLAHWKVGVITLASYTVLLSRLLEISAIKISYYYDIIITWWCFHTSFITPLALRYDDVGKRTTSTLNNDTTIIV